MVFSMRRALGALSLQLFDGLMSARDSLLDGAWLQQLGTLYSASVLLLSIGMFVYWLVCAGNGLAAVEDKLTDEEFDRLRWGKRVSVYLTELAVCLRWVAH